MNLKYLYQQFRESKVLKHIKSARKLFVVLLLAFMIFAFIWFNAMLRPRELGNEVFVQFEVGSGATANELAHQLKEQGLIKNSFVFSLYAKIKGLDVNIQSGKYLLSPTMTPKQILNKMVNGEFINNDIRLTIPEGSTLEKIAEIFHDKGLISKAEFLDVAKVEKFKEEYPFLKELPPNASLEGFLFPDTYFLPRDKNPEYYISILLDRFENIYFGKVNPILKENKFEYTLYQIITLASIVEAESKLENERPVIAGVFYNRLKKGMPLQSCATIAYVLDEHKEILTLDDLEVDSPYNTYKNHDLPPGPIGSPGLSSIMAAANPSKVDYLYFVAKGDGSHVFNKIYADHLKAKSKIQREK